MKLWQENGELNKAVEQYTVGNDYLLDQKLVKYDCIASIAHARMLKKIGVLSSEECDRLENELKVIMKKGIRISERDEDCHTAIENHLTKSLGKIGKKIHTARSRNDQVQAALRLYCKDELKQVAEAVKGFIKAVGKLKRQNTVMPGYTHTRKAMPSSVKRWANAFIDSMKDNLTLLDSVLKLIDQNPLGSGAGYGVPMKVDRKLTAKILDFSKIQNPLYVQNSRGKFEGLIISVLSGIMLDLNKLTSDLIIFSMPEFGFYELPGKFCTGSSIMPHKRNPDVLELVRANYSVVLGYEFQVKTLIGNLISGYHRDFQLTKEPLIKSLDITRGSLRIMKLMLEEVKINKEKCRKAMTPEIFSAKKVHGLVKKGVPYRDAYRMVKQKPI